MKTRKFAEEQIALELHEGTEFTSVVPRLEDLQHTLDVGGRITIAIACRAEWRASRRSRNDRTNRKRHRARYAVRTQVEHRDTKRVSG
jgi:hypothetical protein